MPVFRLGKALAFPPPEMAHESGLLAVGGDLSPSRLLLAYSMGIFPWFSAGQPILWHSPDPRMVLLPNALRTNQSMRQALKKRPYRLTFDLAFRQVISACSETPRPGQDGTWITDSIIDGYCALHAQGYAHSIEAWDGDALVGGLYGVCLGAAFFGESMFARAPDASKIAFIKLCRQLVRWGVSLIDCQVHTEHLDRFGATEWPRDAFLKALSAALKAQPTRLGPWSFDPDLSAPGPCPAA
jgi:leucyl/phenylalanyl-tRNA---protein transferase